MAKSRISKITALQALEINKDEKVVIVDIRDIRERQKIGYIPNSFYARRGMLEFWVDPESPYFKEIFGKEKRYIFHCAAGWRSALAVSSLFDMGFKAEHISDGFAGWVAAGGPVEQMSLKA